MESEELYALKSLFYQSNFKAVLAEPVPSTESPSYLPSLIYTLRSHLAIYPSEPLPSHTADSSPAYRAVTSMASYLGGGDTVEAVEELRELVIEIEGEEGLGWQEGIVRVLGATAFWAEGEVEEALDTLSGETAKRDLECVALTVQIYLHQNRPDLAQRAVDAAKKWADDAVLLQLVEAWVNLRTIPPNYSSSYYTFLELTTLPTPSPALLVARAISQLCQDNIPEAEGSLAEALEKDAGLLDAWALKARNEKGNEAISRVKSLAPQHPLLKEMEAKAALFDEAAAKWPVPKLATTMA